MKIKSVPGVDIAGNKIDMSAVVIVGESGKVYRPTMKLTAGRLAAWESSWYKAKHGLTARDGLKSWLEVREWMKKSDFYEAGVLIAKEIDVTARIADMKTNPILVLLCYFINTDVEDLSEIDDEMIAEKMHDIRYYDTDHLFLLAGTLMPALPRDYVESKIDISIIMEMAKKMQTEMLAKESDPNESESKPSTTT